MSYLKALRTLIAYILLGLLLALPALPLLPFIGVSRWVFNGWLAIDITICTWAHGTKHRSISGWCGQHMSNKKRYYYVSKVIDWLFLVFTKENNHCLTVYFNEADQGLVN